MGACAVGALHQGALALPLAHILVGLVQCVCVRVFVRVRALSQEEVHPFGLLCLLARNISHKFTRIQRAEPLAPLS